MSKVAQQHRAGRIVRHRRVRKKIEGTAAVGSRMPLGGPFLSQAESDQIRAWIQAGAAP